MSDLPVTGGDLAVVAILAVSGVLAFARGFVQETLSMAAWVGAFVAAFFGYPLLAPHVSDFLPDPRLADIAAGVIVFLVAITVLMLITRSLSKHVQGSPLNALDRSLGFVFGLARGCLLVVLIFIGIDFLWKEADQPEWLRDSRSRPLIEDGAEFLRSFVSTSDFERDAAAARRAARDARNLMETERMFREMVSPAPKSDEAPRVNGADGGYGAKQRRDMERLIDTSQGQP